MKSKQGPTMAAVADDAETPPPQSARRHNRENAHFADYKRVESHLISERTNFLYRLLEFGQSKKVPLSLPKTAIACELAQEDIVQVQDSVPDAESQEDQCVSEPAPDDPEPKECPEKDEESVDSPKEDVRVVSVEPKTKIPSCKDSPTRKVSFKVRGNSVSSRRSKMVESRVMLSSNTVAALTTKFNALIHENDCKNEKLNSEGKTVLKIPPNKKQPEIKVIVSRKNSNVKKEVGIACKGTVFKKQQVASVSGVSEESKSKDKRKISISYRPSILGTRSGNVKAAIQIFEQNASSHKPSRPAVKPEVAHGSKWEHPSLRRTDRVPKLDKKGEADDIPAEADKSARSPSKRKEEPDATEKASSDADSGFTDSLPSTCSPELKRIPSPALDPEADVISLTYVMSKPLSEKESGKEEEGKKHVEDKSTQCSFVEDTKSYPENENVPGGSESGCEEDMDRKELKSKLLNAEVDEVELSNPEVDQIESSNPQDGTDNKVELANPQDGTDNKVELENTVACEKPEKKEEALKEPVSKIYEPVETDNAYRSLVDTMKPNSSFLWRSKESMGPPPLPPKKPNIIPLEQIRRLRAAPPLPLEEILPETEEEDSQEDIYDDIHPVSTPDKAYSHLEDDTYDDVGEPPQPPEAKRMVAEDDGYEYCGEPPPYDDCEGEGYQFIGVGEPSSRVPRPRVEEEGIYDDVKSISTMRVCEETTSISNCYESIYNGSRRPARRCTGSSASSSSSRKSGNNSSCDQSNSLYGVGGSRFDSASISQASTVSGEDGIHEVWSYQLTSLGEPRSETSDEWMDLEPSDSEQYYAARGPPRAIVVVQERLRGRKSPSWSRKVRNQWSKSQSENNSESGDSSDSDHNYETLEDITCQNNGDAHSFEDSDSFDSDDSTSNMYVKPLYQDCTEVNNRRLPDPPAAQNIYAISKIAEVAGKKMLELGRSLRRIRTKHTTAGDRTNHVNVNDTSPKLSTVSQPPSVPPPLPPMEKVQSTGNLSGRKTWTLRKFKRSISTSSTSPSTSTFYLSSPVNNSASLVERVPSTGRRFSAEPSIESDSNRQVISSVTGSSSCTASETKLESGGYKRPHPVKPRRPSAPNCRRGSANMRPNSPPPLPPSQPLADSSVKLPSKIDKPISNSWYAAVGLWDTVPGSPSDSSISEQDASHRSDSSTSQEYSGKMQSCFTDEPLYQFYMGTVAELAQRGASSEFDSDGYEEIGNRTPKLQSRPSAMELIKPRDGQHRTLWCEIPEVVNSQVLSTLSPHQKKLQEAKFEIITSEASYMNSLNVLEQHFMSSGELNDDTILAKNDRRILFGNVMPVKKCSEKFLGDLEKCWQDNILLHGICDIIYHHATNYFNVYVKYCSNQIYLDRTLRRLKEQHGRFAEVLTQLEASPKCQLLSLHSFLMLPMQRITRLPLLIDAVLTRLDPKDDEYKSCELALATLNKIVQDCNEGARHMERMEQILILSRQLDFPKEVKAVPIISSSRYLVRSGELVQLVMRGDDAKLTFGKKFSKILLHVFLFTDLLVITKKKSEECYTVIDYCPRNLVQITSTEGLSHLPTKFSSDSGRNIMLFTMLENHEKKTIEMILSCPLESDRQRWLEAVSQPTSENPDERVYEEWDCPQVTAIHPYTANQPDELSLDVSDVVNVLRKMSDGWYQGERIRDGERGWFPGNYTVEIASAHVRARNLKQRYRLLALSGNFLESQRKEKQSK